MLWLVIFSITIPLSILFLLSKDPDRIFGVYSQPGKWFNFKYALFSLMFKLRKRKAAKEKADTNESDAGFGRISRSSVEEMDCAQKLSDHKKAIDAVYFNHANKSGEYMIAAIARRKNNLEQTILYLRLPDIGVLQMLHLPDTEIYDEKSDQEFCSGGLKMEPVVPMKRWRLTFDGKMKRLGTDETLAVKFDFEWTAYTPPFDYDVDMLPNTICKAMATEPWSREFFHRLRDFHQTHYEQFGESSGNVSIEGHEPREVTFRGMRDHSYGKYRDWKQLHRYGIQWAYLEDGTSFSVGIVSYTETLTNLTVGYIFPASGGKHAITWCDWEIWTTGEDGTPPKTLEFKFGGGGGRYTMKCEQIAAPVFYIDERATRIHERMCTYTVNGVAGWGFSEWAYRNN